MIQKVVFIGAGNLATQTSLALHEKGIQILQIYSRTEKSARSLAEKLKCNYTTSVSDIEKNADLYVIAVKDAAIQEILMNLPLREESFLVHTAGSVPIDILKGYTNNYGVFYPLQTFSKSYKTDFSSVPICIEANHPANQVSLQELALKITNSIYQINSEERKILHLAAVFACNFVNHMYTVSEYLLQDRKLNFDLLQPLIKETAGKIQRISPKEGQTGPAVRYDQEVIRQHLESLHDKPEIQKLYSFVTESIFQFHQKP